MVTSMEFDDVIKRQRMTRRFDRTRKVPRELLDKILWDARKAPTAGFSQGFSFLLLDEDSSEQFYEITYPPQFRDEPRPPVIILPLASKKAYIDRYNLPDKAAAGMQKEENWPVPYWIVDTAFASMIVLLSATAAGLGCWFFGIFRSEKELMAQLGVPEEWKPIGVIGLGYPAEKQVKSPSLKLGRRPFEQMVHRGGWNPSA